MTTTLNANGEHKSSPWLSEAVRRLPPYKSPTTAADVAVSSAPHTRLLHLNESPFPPSPKVAEALGAVVQMLNRYPDTHGKALAKAIAARTEVPANHIVFGCGSEELIHALCQVTLNEGDHLVVPAPSFPVFAFAGRLCGATPIRAKLDALGANDTKAIVNAVTDRTRIVFCCTPNPPTGGAMSAAAVEEIVHTVPETALLVIDEAYHEFGVHAGGPNVLPIVARRRGPWVILRTFSKAYSLAGLRLGYALCASEQIAEALHKIKLHYSATTAAQAAALAAFNDEEHLSRTLDSVASERRRLTDALSAIGLSPWPSSANFVSVTLPMPAKNAMEELRRRHILVRDWRDPEFPNELRITVGLADDTDAVTKAIREIL